MISRISLAVALTLLIAQSLSSQEGIFYDISNYDKYKDNGREKMIYFHFKGCPPCKRMDSEVFSDPGLQKYLTNRFDCFSVNGFDAEEKEFRKGFNVSGNPACVFLGGDLREQHRIVGFYTLTDFLAETEKIGSNNSSRYMDSLFNSGYSEKKFLRRYLLVRDQAGSIDSLFVFSYLKNFTNKELLQEDQFKELLTYGYYRGRWVLPAESRWYRVLENAYHNKLFPDYQSTIRNRILFSLIYSIHKVDPKKEVDAFAKLLNAIESYETGDLIVLKGLDMKENQFYALYQHYYPSFRIKYEHALRSGDTSIQQQVLDQYVKKIWNHPKALNSFAWDIYTEGMKASVKLGLKAIKRSIELDPKFNNWDTYAHLLFGDDQFSKAKLAAEKAIQIADEKGVEHSGTVALLEKIHQKLKR